MQNRAFPQIADQVSDHAPRPVVKFNGGERSVEVDQVVDEVRYGLELNGRWVCALTCSPWNIAELAVGRLLSSGHLRGHKVLSIEVDEGRRVISVHAECGDRGLSLASIADDSRVPSPAVLSLEPVEVSSLAMQLEAASELFHRTGGVHGAALARDGKLLAYFVDMGRHNAADKLVGWCHLSGVDASDCVMVFSGRLPLEIMEKVVAIGCPAVIACGAPTNQSLDLAEELGITVVGFAKGSRFNVYTHPWRIADTPADPAVPMALANGRSRAVL